jgi:hypothetical protein
VKIDTSASLNAEELEEAWRLYCEAFDEMRSASVHRRVMHRAEFDAVMADRRVDKYLAIGTGRPGGGQLCGLATYTNDLDAVPLISPQYFQRRWPERFARRRIWYCGFVAVAPGAEQGETGTVFGALVEAMYRVAAAGDGIIALDFCRHDHEVHRMPRAVRLMLHRLSGSVHCQRLDEQSYWLYEFPAA